MLRGGRRGRGGFSEAVFIKVRRTDSLEKGCGKWGPKRGTCGVLTLLLWAQGTLRRRHGSVLCSEHLPPRSRHSWSLRPRRWLVTLCL